jgi:hypothetical protein
VRGEDIGACSTETRLVGRYRWIVIRVWFISIRVYSSKVGGSSRKGLGYIYVRGFVTILVKEI